MSQGVKMAELRLNCSTFHEKSKKGVAEVGLNASNKH